MTAPENIPNFEHAVILDPPKTPGMAPGTVIALAGEAGRYTRFAICMQALINRLPPGTSMKWILGSDIAESRNRACEEMDGDWIWFIDDDHSFPETMVMRLLLRGVDIIAPLCLRRNQPFLPVACVDGDFMDITRYQPEELVEVEHTGSSGMLIQKRVLDALEPPWFELGRREGDGNRVSEDVTFCRRAREAGFKIHVDMAERLGHITTAIITPAWSEEDERWLTSFTVADGARLWINPAVPEPAEADGPEQ